MRENINRSKPVPNKLAIYLSVFFLLFSRDTKAGPCGTVSLKPVKALMQQLLRKHALARVRCLFLKNKIVCEIPLTAETEISLNSCLS